MTTTTMKAIGYDRYGPVDVLDYRSMPMPEVRPGKVLLRVSAAGVNPADWHMMTGTPVVVRLMGSGLLKPKKPTLGIDFSGTVVGLGEGVTAWQIGDRVYGAGSGTYAEYVLADADRVNAVSPRMTMLTGAGVGVAAITALQGLRDKAKLRPGDHVLINGASGGVGTFAVQIAKLMGAEVTGVCSTRNLELVRSLGADHVIDYTSTDFTASDVAYNAIFDNVGSHSFRRYRNVLTEDGVVVMVGGEKSGLLKMIAQGLKTAVQALMAPQRAAMFIADEKPADLATLHEWLDAGEITTVIDRTYPLEEAADALRYLETQRARGKVILTVDDDLGATNGA